MTPLHGFFLSLKVGKQYSPVGRGGPKNFEVLTRKRESCHCSSPVSRKPLVLLRLPRFYPLLLVLALQSLGWASAFSDHDILDAQADIEELDVGDIEDMEADVPPTFKEDMKRRNFKMPSLQDVKDPMEWAAQAQGGMSMTFATLKQSEAEKLGKEGTEQLSSRWKTLLETGGVNAQTYAVDPGKLLFVTNGPGLIWKVKDFVLQQPETDWFEYQQQRFYPEGRNEPITDHEARKKREEELGWRAPAKPKPKPKKERRRGRRKKEKAEEGKDKEEL